jgi:hypothetical protein
MIDRHFELFAGRRTWPAYVRAAQTLMQSLIDSRIKSRRTPPPPAPARGVVKVTVDENDICR